MSQKSELEAQYYASEDKAERKVLAKRIKAAKNVEERSLYETIVLNASDRMSRVSEATDKYQAGDRNAVEQGLMGGFNAAAGAMEVVGEPVGQAISAITPDFIKKGLLELASGVMNTDTAKAAMQWIKENPRASENIGNTVGLASEIGMGGLLGKIPGLPKEAIDSAARNMPNELGEFYKGGKLNQVKSIATALPSTALNMAKETFNPKAQARLEQGVSPKLRSVAQSKLKEDSAAGYSFVEGQLDQSHLLGLGGGKANPALQAIHGDLQSIGTGKLDSDTFARTITDFRPELFEDMDMEGVTDQFLKMVKEAQGQTDAEVTIRHPSALTSLASEGSGGQQSSKSAKRIAAMRKLEREYYPKKQGFNSDDEMKEFLAGRYLVDDTIVRVDGKPMTKADRKVHKMIGEGKRYKTAEGGLKPIKEYYRLRDMVAKGKDLSPEDHKEYLKLRNRINEAKENITIKDGKAFFNSSHKSAAKGLGGVADHFMMDRKGNVLHMISDENDLLGQKVPGDKNVITVTPPSRFNIFEETKTPPDAKATALKKAHAAKLEREFAAPDTGTRLQNLRKQQAQAIVNVNPKAQARHYSTPAAGMLGGVELLKAAGSTEEE
jgi:hypothetical protein